MEKRLYPYKMEPIYRDMLWGGTKLNREYGKSSPFDKTGESWEVSCRPNGVTVCGNGAYAGAGLDRLMPELGHELTGYGPAGRFPVLFKLIDAARRLSVQVHPDGAAAVRLGGESKTEMWIVLEAEQGAGLYLGFDRPLDRGRLERHIREGSLEEMLSFTPVCAGDCFFIPAGAVHAIGEGVVIAEIQENSDTTYRVYDWGRVDSAGQPRQLHIAQSLACADTALRPAKAQAIKSRSGGAKLSFWPGCELFTACGIFLDGVYASGTDDAEGGRMQFLFAAEGNGLISARGGEYPFVKGDTYILPAALGHYTLCGTAEVYAFFVPGGTAK